MGDVSASKPLVAGTPTMLIKKNVLEEFGGTYEDSIGLIGSDWGLMTRICQKYKVDYVPESLVRVYINHGPARLSTDFYSEGKKNNYFSQSFSREV